MYFSEYFRVSKANIEEYGAINISLVCDLPLFIDPMLIFNSKKKNYQALHRNIIKYFEFLYKKSQAGLTQGEIKSFFEFNEISNNWLGFSKNGNKGNGLGWKYAKFLSENLEFINNNNGVSKSNHIEKSLLLYEGNGKDKISDMTTNLILEFLLDYTQTFALKYINKKYLREFAVDCGFDYKTETPKNCTFTLPFIINDKGQDEFVILTPKDILRKSQPAICRQNFQNSMSEVRDSIDNDVLRSRINNYVAVRLAQFIKDCEQNQYKPSERELTKKENSLWLEAAKEYPILYDYFIKFVEGKGSDIESLSSEEVEVQIDKFFTKSDILISVFKNKYKQAKNVPNTREELIQRIGFFKNCIEDCDCYKCFYDKNGNRISSEDDLQRFFRLVWFGTIYDVNYEANNGRGELDVKVSFGAADKTIAEFKLASNPKLKSICEQTEIYEKATQTTNDSLYVIFFFTLEEELYVKKLINESKNREKLIKNTILIDCRIDNKTSASKIKN